MHAAEVAQQVADLPARAGRHLGVQTGPLRHVVTGENMVTLAAGRPHIGAQ
jgi:hypothetical protein